MVPRNSSRNSDPGAHSRLPHPPLLTTVRSSHLHLSNRYREMMQQRKATSPALPLQGLRTYGESRLLSLTLNSHHFPSEPSTELLDLTLRKP